jgi:hypothetical protein
LSPALVLSPVFVVDPVDPPSPSVLGVPGLPRPASEALRFPASRLDPCCSSFEPRYVFK